MSVRGYRTEPKGAIISEMVALFAHRGSHRAHPENTAPAFEAAITEGADGVELDVRTSADGAVIVWHDADLSRLAGRRERVAEMSWPELRAVDAQGTRPILLDEAIDMILPAGLELNVEVKGDVPNRRATALAVARTLAARRRSERAQILLSTFDPRTLAVLRARVPSTRLGFLFDREHTGRLRAALLSRVLPLDGLHPEAGLCTTRRLRRWRARGLYSAAWTVMDERQARELARNGIDAIITDDVPRIRAALESTQPP